INESWVSVPDQILGNFPENPSSCHGVDTRLQVNQPRQHAHDVRVQNRCRLIESKTNDCSRGVASNTGKLDQIGHVLWKFTVTTLDQSARATVKIPGPIIIS